MNPTRWSCPGKVFLLGEYAVLAGLPAWLITLGPRFWLEARPRREGDPEELPLGVAPESPAGRLLLSAIQREPTLSASLPRLEFDDPFAGAGGFGASTAQYALLSSALSSLRKPQKDSSEPLASAFRFYRELYADAPIPPSGADLAAQWIGGVTRFEPQGPTEMTAERETRGGRLWSRLWIFSATQQAGRKAATHVHLQDLGRKKSDPIAMARTRLAPLLARVPDILERQDGVALGALLTDYAETLRSEGLEIPATTEDRQFALEFDGILGVKGTGALQADALVVAIDPERLRMEEFLSAMERRGLRFLGCADLDEAGLRAEKPVESNSSGESQG